MDEYTLLYKDPVEHSLEQWNWLFWLTKISPLSDWPRGSKCRRSIWLSSCTGFHSHHVMRKESIANQMICHKLTAIIKFFAFLSACDSSWGDQNDADESATGDVSRDHPWTPSETDSRGGPRQLDDYCWKSTWPRWIHEGNQQVWGAVYKSKWYTLFLFGHVLCNAFQTLIFLFLNLLLCL